MTFNIVVRRNPAYNVRVLPRIIPPTSGGAIVSVNGQFGPTVLLDADDISDTSTTAKFTTTAEKANWNTAYGWGNHASAGYALSSGLATVATTGAYSDLSGTPTLGTAAASDTGDFATAAQGSLADSAVQPGDLATVATTGDYDDLINKPTLGTAAAADTGDFASAAQGSLADSATQPGDLAAVATSGAYSDLTGTPTLGALAAKDEAAVGDIDATGTPSASTYLRGDGTWSTPSGSGDMVFATDVIDDDTFATASATTVPTSESVKAYVDANAGGGGGMSDLVDDTTPQLGGNLDLNSFTVGDASAADLTKLSEVTATSTELNYVDGVTSAIQTQINGKAATSHTHTASDVTDFSTAADARISAAIGSTVQGYSANLAEWSGINPSANGGSLVAAADYAAMRVLLNVEDGADVSEVFLAARNRFTGYTPNYNLDNAMTEGAGTDLSVQHIFDMGSITLPSGANKQHCVMRFAGTATNGDAFETAGAKFISGNMFSDNADAYCVIMKVTLSDGDKEVKAIYGRAVNESTDGGVVVGLVGAAECATGSTTDAAYALQLSHDGPALATSGYNRLISMGTNETSKEVDYGVYAEEALGFDKAFIRGYSTNGSGHFLQWGTASGDAFRVGSGGGVYTKGQFEIAFEGSGNTPILLTKYNASGGNEFRYRRARGTLASPSAILNNDVLGDLAFHGHDGSNFVSIGMVRCRAEGDWSVGNTPAYLEFSTGTTAIAARMRIHGDGGVTIGSPTGSSKGAGTLNAVGVYDDNTLLTDYVFDYAVTGAVKAEDGEKAEAFAAKGADLLDIEKFSAFWKTERHLPSMPSRDEWAEGSKSVGDLIQRLWETVEVQAVHIAELNERLKALGG